MLDSLELQVLNVGKDHVPEPWWPAELDQAWPEGE
jgi:hypothetical protein